MSDRLEKLMDLWHSTPNDDGFIQFAIAKEYEQRSDDQTARAWLTRLIENNENYVGAYYHLAKVLERVGSAEETLKIYDRGMTIAKKCGDTHAYAELQNARMNFELGL